MPTLNSRGSAESKGFLQMSCAARKPQTIRVDRAAAAVGERHDFTRRRLS